MEDVFIIIALILAGVAFSWLFRILREAKLYRARKERLDLLEIDEKSLASERARIDKIKESLPQIAAEKSIGFPWLAEAYADFFHLEDMRVATSLALKKRPAIKASDEIRETASRRRTAEKELRILRYQMRMFETLFPWLTEFREDGIDEELLKVSQESQGNGEDNDEAKKWLTDEEYLQLPDAQKFQMALDRYRTSRRSKWQVGRDYERFIGFLYESEGFRVMYHGIEEGLEDMGRDLICEKGGRITIVQCKCWASERTIHEKHIFQLFGSVHAYRIDHPGTLVTGHFVTSTKLSPRAALFADSLHIKVRQEMRLADYPCIKCNISARNSSRIYHLPFDQQYDRTMIIPNTGEFYASTVEEAEAAGFRRAFRYRGPV